MATPDPQWYRDGVIYELNVRSFQDSNGDGIGDFPGLTRRLDYIQDLGVSAIWLLPFYPSPLRDDGYDIADYRNVHPHCGTLEDFQQFLDEAHRRRLRVITELVINHTSDEHPWFRRARTAPPASAEREFYVWSETAERYGDARIIFEDFEPSNWSWDPVAGAYYWHRFYSHQPDLNYDNPQVFAAVLDVLQFWFGMGVDGMRLDAVPYLVEREGTHSENLRPTHHILKRLRRHVDATYPRRMFIAEANQWPEDAVAYFGDGDESHMVFHFPLMPRLFMAIRQEDRLPIVDILAQTPEPPDGCQWALFLRNHDELTLEMVTEEERLYMYHVYAINPAARLNLGIRRRLAPLLGNHRRRIELMNALLLSLPGTPVLYYGDEIGMGDNIYLGDRKGVRTPMQWSGDRNAGFSTAGPQRLHLPLIVDDEYHYQSVHVEQQLRNTHSLLWWMKRLIALRNRHQAFGRGALGVLQPESRSVLAFVRTWSGERILVVANLSRFVQHTNIDMSEYQGLVPVEMLGRTRLPPISRDPYPLTLAPHGFLWLRLVDAEERSDAQDRPLLTVMRSWEEVFDVSGRGALESLLPRYLERCPTCGGGSRMILSARIEDVLLAGTGRTRRALAIVWVGFASGEPERTLLPLAVRAREDSHEAVVANLEITARDEQLELYDVGEDRALGRALLQLARRGSVLDGFGGALRVVPEHRRVSVQKAGSRRLRRSRPSSNAVIPLGRSLVLKLFRRLHTGAAPGLEVSRHLTARGFRHTPPVVASIHYQPAGPGRRDSHEIGMLLPYVEHEADAWERAVEAAGMAARHASSRRAPAAVPVEFASPARNRELDAIVGEYRACVDRLATRTADLHRTLADAGDAAFAPEPFTTLSQRSTYQRIRTLIVSVTEQLRMRIESLAPHLLRPARHLVAGQEGLVASLAPLLRTRSRALRIRCHGDYHLGHILHTGRDLTILDFDGERARPAYERRLKHSPLRDIAIMVRSFHYAGFAALQQLPPARRDRARPWLDAWSRHVSALFIGAYIDAMDGSGLLPPDPHAAKLLFNTYLLERAFYELGTELDRGGAWLEAPLVHLARMVRTETTEIAEA